MYFQGDVHLRKKKVDVDRYDPVGVLCDLYAQEMGEQWVYCDKTANYSMHGHKHLCPPEVAKWAGLKRNGCFIPVIVEGEKLCIMDISDMERKFDFDQIADIIEQCL